jgi:FkbM family methyltransferase
MIITNEWIKERVNYWIDSKKDPIYIYRERERRLLYRLKQYFPVKIRERIEWHLKPMVDRFRNRKKTKYSEKRYYRYAPLNPLAVNFMRYCYNNVINFDVSKYFDEEDYDSVIRHIDNRIKHVIAGFDYEPYNEVQLRSIKTHKELCKKVRFVSGTGWDVVTKITLPDGYTYTMPNTKGSYAPSTFIMHYGLADMKQEVKDYIAGKVFLDVGAFIGDASIGFLHYHPSEIMAFEPLSWEYNNLCNTVKWNQHVPDINKIKPIQMGLGDEETEAEISEDRGSSSMIADIKAVNIPKAKVKITTVDKSCADKTVGLIKMDVEGFEYYVIKGALETIARDKPVLLISIYHTGKDFFEIPPMIQQRCPSYRFKYLDHFPESLIGEKILVGYDTALTVSQSGSQFYFLQSK